MGPRAGGNDDDGGGIALTQTSRPRRGHADARALNFDISTVSETPTLRQFSRLVLLVAASTSFLCIVPAPERSRYFSLDANFLLRRSEIKTVINIIFFLRKKSELY